MERTKNFFASTLSFALLFFLASTAWGQIDVGDFTIRGEAEIGGLPRHKNGQDAKFEEYRDLPESVIVPQLQLMIGGKKEDFYLKFDATKVGRDDQNFILRFGRYGLLDIEFEWDQFPHLFNVDTARTPYATRLGNGGTYTLGSKATATVTSNTASLGNPAVPATFPNGTPASATCAENPFCTWLNANAQSVDLKLFNGIGRFKLRYTPTPGWTFTGSYWSNNNAGKRAIGSYFGTSPGTYAITELPEPIDYQTHNIELGGEYAGNGWSLGLKYNASLFHNNTSTLVWDSAINISGVGSSCVDARLYSISSTTGAVTSAGPCRGRMDLYPSNQAHTFTLTGTARLPLKTQFLSTISYGWRLQDDSFLPFTINRCYTSDPALVGTTDATRCTTALVAMPTISRRNLDGDVRPFMVNATLVNNYFDALNLKAYYRLYNLDNRSKEFVLAQGIVLSDTGNPADAGAETRSRLEYSKNTVGLDASYNMTRWLTAKLSYAWERMHREEFRQLRNADEHSLGPTIDIKPLSWLLFRASYKHFWRSADHYEFEDDIANVSRMFDQAARDRDKTSLFAQITPWDSLTLYAGFEHTSDRFTKSVLGAQNDFNYSPSMGVMYMPLDWLRLFADYNWDRFDWLLAGMQRSSTTQNPDDPATCDANCQLRKWSSRGREQIHTISVGSDMRLIKDLLGLRLQYGFSDAASAVRGSGATCLSSAGLPFPAPSPGGAGAFSSCTPATDYHTITNRWHEFLARFEYLVHKHVTLNFGYYYNRYNTKDFGVDIMKLWMGDQDQWSITGNANLGRSIFLGDQLKGAYTAHVGFLGVKFKF